MPDRSEKQGTEWCSNLWFGRTWEVDQSHRRVERYSGRARDSNHQHGQRGGASIVRNRAWRHKVHREFKKWTYSRLLVQFFANCHPPTRLKRAFLFFSTTLSRARRSQKILHSISLQLCCFKIRSNSVIRNLMEPAKSVHCDQVFIITECWIYLIIITECSS